MDDHVTGDMDVGDMDLDARPKARLGYSVDDLRAYAEVAELRIAELQAAVAAGRARLDDAHRRTAAASDLRRRIAQRFLGAWDDSSAAPALAVADA